MESMPSLWRLLVRTKNALHKDVSRSNFLFVQTVDNSLAPTPTPSPTATAIPTLTPTSSPSVISDVSFISTWVNSTRTTVTLNIQASTSCTVWCAAFVSGGLGPTDVHDISGHSLAQSVDVLFSSPSSITIRTLVPSSLYDVYCYSESASGITTPMEVVWASVVVTETACCKNLFLATPILNVRQGEDASDEFTLAADYAPTNSLHLALFVARTGDYQTSCPPTNESYVALEGAIKPAAANFTSAVASMTFVLKPTESACFVLFITTSGALHACMGLAFCPHQTLGVSAAEFGDFPPYVFSVMAFDAAAPPPEPLSAMFGSSASFIDIEFDRATDYGNSIIADFECASLLEFPGIEVANRCYWKDAFTIRVILGYYATLLPGDTVTIYGDKLRAQCVVTEGCDLWPTMNTTREKSPSG